MKLRATWLGILLALCAMQAHALLHLEHEPTGADPACLSCKVGQQLDAGLQAASASMVLVPSAADVARIGSTADVQPSRVQTPPARAPPALY